MPASLVSSVKVPTLILTGSKAAPWADNAAQALIAKLPGSHHCVLEGQSHAVAWDVLAPALKEYFSRSA